MGKKGPDFQQKCGDSRHGSHDAVVFTWMKVKLAMVGAKEKIQQESPTTQKKNHLTNHPNILLEYPRNLSPTLCQAKLISKFYTDNRPQKSSSDIIILLPNP